MCLKVYSSWLPKRTECCGIGRNLPMSAIKLSERFCSRVRELIGRIQQPLDNQQRAARAASAWTRHLTLREIVYACRSVCVTEAWEARPANSKPGEFHRLPGVYAAAPPSGKTLAATLRMNCDTFWEGCKTPATQFSIV